jgi:uncharacterized protein (TIGR03435 family)
MRAYSGYQLTAAKRDTKLSPAKVHSSPAAYLFVNEVRARAYPLSGFANKISSVIGQPIRDATGINGSYDFDLHFAGPEETDSALPSIFTALEEQYCLKLTPAKVPVESLIIDHVDLVPVEN